MAEALHELRLAFRVMRQRPLFATVAIVSLAVGLGASTAIFSVVNALLLRPLPGVGEPDRAVEIGRTTGGRGFDTFAYREMLDIREQVPSLEQVAGWTIRPVSLSAGGEGQRALGMLTSWNYFAALGVRPLLGRFATPDEDIVGAQGAVAVLSWQFWQQRMGADPGILGREISIDRHAFTVIGVTPPEFRGNVVGIAPDVYIPITTAGVLVPGLTDFDSYRASWFTIVGRLAPGGTLPQAQAALNALFARMPQEAAEGDLRNLRGARVMPLGPIPGAGRTIVTAFLGMLFGVVGLVLLIACSNVAGMLIARATARGREIAIRLALGAGRLRLVRQLLVEALALFVLGGLAGIALAWWGVGLVSRIHLPVPIPVDFDFRPDGRVLGFGLLLALSSGVIFGLAPALQATRFAVVGALKNEAARRGSRGGRLRRVFVAAQIALSVILLVCAGLFLRSLQRAAQITTGFDPAGVHALSFNLAINGYDDVAGAAFERDLLDRVRSVPGIPAAAFASDLPLDGSKSGEPAYPEDSAAGRRRDGMDASFCVVSDGYFELLGVKLLRGRVFNSADGPSAEPVIVVSRSFAESAWPGSEAVGRRVRVGGPDQPLRTIIGVVDNVKNQMLSEQPEPMYYLPLTQRYDGSLYLLTKGPGDGAAAAAAALRTVRAQDPRLSLTEPQSLAAITSLGVLPQRIAASLSSSLGLLALLLSAIGVYGVIAFMVAQRTREIGVRMALGARRPDVFALVLRGGLLLALPGFAIGLLAALALSRLLRSFLLGVPTLDPVTFLGMPAVLLVTIILAALGPARRASAVQPVRALRSD